MSKDKKQKKLTSIQYVLDRSGSMHDLAEAAVKGFNDFLTDQQKETGDTELSLVLFDDEILRPVNHCPVAKVPRLDHETYRVGNCTALLDAVGKTIKRTRKHVAKLEDKGVDVQVVFAIFTDGLENASHRYSFEKISRMIRKRRKKDGWEFLFLAAGQDAIASASQMAIPASHAARVAGTKDGQRVTSRSFSRKVKSLRDSHFLGARSADYLKTMGDIVSDVEDDES